MTTTPDPRPLYADALTWVHGLMTRVDDARLADPTPCPEFDVAALLGHLVATVDRVRVFGECGDPASVPFAIGDLADPADAYRAATAKMWTIWSDDTLLDRSVSVPWGTVPGRAAVWGYLNETLVHGWDLALATGQDPEANPRLAEQALDAAVWFIPAEPRGGPVPFGPVVTSRPDAGPTERLANWSGRARR